MSETADQDQLLDQEPELTTAPEAIQTKRLIVCCDGTGQSSSTGTAKVPTNVFRFAQALKTSIRTEDYPATETTPHEPSVEIPQIVLYQTGIGADGVSSISKTIAKAFGVGIDAHILEAYTFLASNYEEGDEIFLFGFSRGAFTARAIASLICNAGLLNKDSLQYLPMIYDRYRARRDTKDKRDEFERWIEKHQERFHLQQNVVIRILGLWDTVGSLGVPESSIGSFLRKTGLAYDLNEGYGYHDTSLPSPKISDKKWRAFIVAAYQALALEENRYSFSPTLLRLPLLGEDERVFGEGTGFIQCWFPGVHTDVGGGYERAYRDISDIAFAWMVDLCGGKLEFRGGISGLLKKSTLQVLDPDAPLPKNHKMPLDRGWGLSEKHDEYSGSLFVAAGERIRTPGEYFSGQKHDENGAAFETREYMHPSVRMRYLKPDANGKKWRPKALDQFVLKQDAADGSWRWEKKAKNGEVVVLLEEQISDLQSTMMTKEDKEFLGLADFEADPTV